MPMPRPNAIRDLPSPTAYVPPKLVPVKPLAPPPIARARADEEIVPPSFRIPTPEELGIGTPAISNPAIVSGQKPVDWEMVDRKLDRLGAIAHQMERTSTGFVFTIRLPEGIVTGSGATKREAVQRAFAKTAK
jgi:hypothetical protein